MAYVFTVSKPSSVRIACKARFISADQESLITASSNLLHVYQSHSLTPSHEIVCYGRISTITPFKHWNSKLDLLFVTTDDQKYFTVSFEEGRLVTGVAGDLTTRGLATPDMGHKVIVNERHIILYLYNGIISVISITQNSNPKKRTADSSKILGAPQQVRLDELKIHDIAMLDGEAATTTFGVLFRGSDLATHFKSYELHVRKGDLELRKGGIVMAGLKHGTSMIISRGTHGVVCVGETTFYTKSVSDNEMEFPITTPTLFNSSTAVSADQFILGDDYGLLYSLTFEESRPVLSQIALPADPDTAVPRISIPHVLVALQNELFLGSHYGDSQLLQLPQMEIIARKINIGPIQDILVESGNTAGASATLVTASGAYKDGSLKIVRYGVGMVDKAELEIENIRALWGLDELGIIVVGFVDSYIVLQVSPEGEIEQIDSGEEELVYACCSGSNLVLLKHDELSILRDGVIVTTQEISFATSAKCLDDRLYIQSKAQIDVWQLSADSCSHTGAKKFEAEISALEVQYGLVIVGFWNADKLWIGDLDLNEVLSTELETGRTPHSICLQILPSISIATLFIGTNDGNLITYNFDTDKRSLDNLKVSVLGTTPVSLSVFKTAQGPNIFAVSDRPTIIYAARAKVTFSSFDIPSCTFFTAFNSQALQCSMIVGTETGLRIGGIDDIQKLQFRSIALGELPRRLVRAAGFIGALTMRMEVEQVTGNETQRSYLKIYHADTFEPLGAFELQENEMCQSLCHMEIDGSDRFIVGTSYTDDEQDECIKGRIIILGINRADSSLWLESQIEVPGSVYCISSVGDRLVAGINSFVRLYEVSASSIAEISKFRASTFALAIAVRDSRLLVGDLMKSVLYLEVRDGELTEIARDYVPTWMTSVSFASSTTFLGAEAEGNLVLLAESDSPLEENRSRLDRIGEFRYGEMINKLVPGVLVMPEATTLVTPHTIFGTVDGSIGVVGDIDPKQVDFLIRLQGSIGENRHSVGGLRHADYRAYTCPGTKNIAPLRFVDGDLIEEFLELDKRTQLKICGEVGQGLAEVEKMVEDLARLR